jgi:hypothetical protein
MLSANIKQRINSTYAEYNDGTVELEARFGKITAKGFKPGVSIQVFNRIKDYFDTRSETVTTKTTDYISKNVRKTVTVPSEGEQTKVIWIQKTRLWNQEDRNYGVRYSMSREIPIHPVDNFVPDIIREKNRSSYYVFGGMVRIDITIVNMIQGLSGRSGMKDRSKYEVEVELISPNGLNAFEKAIYVTLQRVLDTITLYTAREATDLINFVNMILGSNKRGILDHYPLVQARNLKMKDMVWGGLLGNKDTGYSVTHKADGIRKMLVFHSSGIWLVMAPHTLNRITNTAVPTLTGTILDGEMIPVNKRLEGSPATNIWYLAFDCLSWSNDKSIQLKPHGMRMNHAQAVADVIKNQLIYVNTKSFRNFGTPQEFFTVMREMFREQSHLSYLQDGFMFTPVNSVYNPHSDKNPLYRRVLTKYPDICKGKPKEQLTVDFKIEWKAVPEGYSVIKLYVNRKGKPVLFNGTKVFPYRDTIDSFHPLTQGLPSGTIVEYGWDYKRELFIPHRIRHDKTKPNREDIAEDVWMDIMRPLTEETMKGETLDLMRRYHNRIKTHLYTYPGPGKTLLDIGSGRGGDVSKWKQYSRIVAVEPNQEHIVELERRLELQGMRDRVRIVNTGGEDTATIYHHVREFIGDRVDVVSTMLSMSFFWRSSEMVNSLVNTIATNIKRDGNMVFLTIDGDLVEQTFEPAFNTGPVLTRMDLGPATLRYYGDKTPKELHIHIEGTIVQDQTEWLVRLGDLITRMGNVGFSIIERKRADEERFLTEEEITLTQMYTYGIFGSDRTDIVMPELSDMGLIPIPKPSVSLLPPVDTMGVSKELVTKPLKTIQPIFGIPDLSETEATETIEKEKAPTIKMEEQLPIFTPSGLPTVSGLQPIMGLPPVTTVLSPVTTGLPPVTTGLPPVTTGLPPVTTGLPPVTTKDIEKPGIVPDTHEVIRVSWYPAETVVRIGAIGDGSCFFHATLNGYYIPYQNNNDTSYRMDLVRKLRRDIAYSLETPDPDNPGLIMWDTASGGQFADLYKQQLMGVNFTDIFNYPVDFSLDGLQRLLNSTSYLGNEVYQYASDMLGVDIYVMRLTNVDLYVHQNTATQGVERRAIVISGNGKHYETIGIERNGLYQTLFDQNDPFILAIRSRIDDEGGN